MKSIKDIVSIDFSKGLPEDLSTSEKAKFLHKSQPDEARFLCNICEDRGIVLEGETARPCKCMKLKKLENQFRHARISRALQNCTFESFMFTYYLSGDSFDRSHYENAQKAFNAAKEFVSDYLKNPFGLGLLFTGPVGSGKTYLAASIANALTAEGQQTLFLVVPDLLDELRATFKTEVNELDLLDTAREIPLLILDDLGAHNYTDWTRNRLYSIINYRMNEHLPTIVTTNLTLDEMEEYLGARTTSRLIQTSRIFRLTVDVDIRHRKYQEREGKK
ncbi:MAG: ATP-binding protein [Desulfitobacterium hafniense]|nr:ATP-binding protein [Desulfitobacterium hafniense]